MSKEDTSLPMRERMSTYILGLQDTIVSALEAVDPGAPKFKRDTWERAQGGRGVSCVFAAPPSDSPDATPSTDTILEKAGVNISIVHGTLPPAAVRQMVADHSTIPFDPTRPQAMPFFAAGISLVIHPRNPNAPTVHANYRYFELSAPAAEGTSLDTASTTTTSSTGSTATPVADPSATPLAWWFGGGADLTPSYLFEEDAAHFHGALKAACDAHGAALHPAFKKWCDEYFFIPHRGEARGVGGIFFDDLSDAPHKRLNETGAAGEEQQQEKQLGIGGKRPHTPDEIFAFVKSCGDAFVPSYLPILNRRKDMTFDAGMRRWQLLRRGRYVEFNLVYDRGTKFGLMTPGARVESILMSLPETARWEYMSDMGTQEGSEEAKLLEVVKNPKDWV